LVAHHAPLQFCHHSLDASPPVLPACAQQVVACSHGEWKRADGAPSLRPPRLCGKRFSRISEEPRASRVHASNVHVVTSPSSRPCDSLLA